MIPLDGGTTLFVYGFNSKSEMVFRTSLNINHLQNEAVVVDRGMLFTNMYHIPVSMLEIYIGDNGQFIKDETLDIDVC